MAILVTSYVNPDLDGYACAYAYAELLRKAGIDATAGISGTPSLEAKWLVSAYGLPQLSTLDSKQFDSIILVDTSDSQHLDPNVDVDKVIEVIDHRQVHRLEEFKHAKVQIELVGAAATLIAERFSKENIKPSKEAAMLLHAAIISNTENFLASMTTQRDRNAAQKLSIITKLPDGFAHKMFSAKSDLGGGKLAEQIIGDIAYYSFGSKSIGIAQLEIIDSETLVKARLTEILSLLSEIKKDKELDYCYLSIVDLEKRHNIYVTEDSAQLLAQALGVTFSNYLGRATPAIMRKQAVPKLKALLETAVQNH